MVYMCCVVECVCGWVRGGGGGGGGGEGLTVVCMSVDTEGVTLALGPR